MKKKPHVLLVVGLVLGSMFPITATSQEFTEAGVLLGGSRTTFQSNIGDDLVDFDDLYTGKIGLSIGGFATLSFTENIALQPELLFTQKGVTINFEEDDEIFGPMEIDGAIDLTYLEFPVLLRYTFPTPSPWRPHLLAGPALGFNLSSEATVSALGFTASEDIGDETSNLDVSLVFGGAVDYAFDFGRVGVGVRYVLGLSNIWRSDDTNGFLEIAPDEAVRNRALSILLGVSFGL